MMHKDQIDLSDHQTVSITRADLRALITLLECVSAHLLMPPEADAALTRLQKLRDHH